MIMELVTRRFVLGRDRRRRPLAVRSAAAWVIAGCAVLLTLEPQHASAANECGVAVPAGSVTCALPSYLGGITYMGTNGLTVNIASGGAVSNASGSAAIDLEGSGALTLNALSAKVTGSGTHANFTYAGANFRPAIYYGVLGYSTTGPLSLNVGQVTDSSSGGILGIGGYSNSGAVSVQSTTLNLTGLSAIGINVEGASATVTSEAINATLRGIVAFGDAGNVNVTSTTINVTDNSMFLGTGIQAFALSGVGNITVNSGTITATGSNGVAGILAQSGTSNGKTTIVSGSIAANGNGQYGIAAFGSSAVDITSTGTITTNGGFRIVNDTKAAGGTQSDPRFSAGIWVVESTNSVSVKNQGSITTTGDTAYGIRIEAGTNATSIPDLNGQADLQPITITNSTVTTNGNNAAGIYVLADKSAVTLTSGTVKTSGASANAIDVENNGGLISITSTDAEATGGSNTRAIYANNSGGGVTIVSGTTVGNSGILGLGLGDVSITSTSAQSSNKGGVLGLAGGKLTINSGSSVSVGAGSVAIFGAAIGSVSITSGVATTTGDVSGSGASASIAYGILTLSQTSAVTLASTTVSTAGIFAPGINAQADNGTLTLTSGAVTTSGAGSMGIYAKAVGATITSTSIATSGGTYAFAGGTGITGSPIQPDAFAAATYAADGLDLFVNTGGATVNSGTITTGASGNGMVVTGTTGALKLSSSAITAFGDGIDATTTTGAITVSSTAINAGGFGINASSTGATGIAAGAVSITSDTLKSAGTGIFATGLSVAVTNSTRIDASLQGIHAAASTGGLTINSGTVIVSNGGAGPVNNIYADGINATANGGLISITSSDSETTGMLASGIYANNSGGGVTINSGTTKVTGANASSIVAKATGNIVLTSGAANGTGNPAINAQSGTGSITLTSTTASGLGGNPTIFASTNGMVAVTAGNTTSTGDAAIYVIGGGGASVVSTNASGANEAINASSSNGSVSVNSGTASSSGRAAIVAFGQGAVTVNSTDAHSTAVNAAINAQSAGGSVSITSTSASSGATALYAVSAAGNISITSGTASDFADNYPAIWAINNSSAGTNTINATSTSATGTNSAAIVSTNYGLGENVINISGSAFSQYSYGVLSDGNTSVTIAANGSATGTIGVAGVIDQGIGGAFVHTNLTNYGVITGTSGSAVQIAGRSSSVSNYGTINGTVGITGTGTSTFVNSGVLKGSLSLSDDANIVNNTGTIVGNITLWGTNGQQIVSSGAVTGTAAHTSTIYAYNSGTATAAAANQITVGSTSATGTGSNAVELYDLQVSTDYGTAFDYHQIASSPNVISLSGSVSAASGTALLSVSNIGSTITNNGQLSGSTGIVVQKGSSALSYYTGATIYNYGSIAGTSGVAGTFGDDVTAFYNHGTITGSITLSGAGYFVPRAGPFPATSGNNFFDNYGTLNGSLNAGNGSIALRSGSTVTGKIQGNTLELFGGGSIASSQLSGFQTIFKLDDGRWSLTGGANSLAAQWVIQTGVISISDDRALGTGVSEVLGSGVVQIDGGAELEVTATTGGTRTFVFAGLGSGINVAAGATYTLNGTLVNYGSATATAIDVNGGGGTGWLVFGKDNRATLSATINVYRGGIYAAVTGAFGTGKINIYDPDLGIGDGVTVANDITVQDQLNITQDAGTGIISGVISQSVPGSGITVTSASVPGTGVTSSGSGKLVLTGSNTFTGVTTINSGTLAIAGGGSIASSSGVVDNGALDISGASSAASIQNLTGSGQVSLGSNTLTLTNAAGTFSGTISGTGGVTITGGTETLTGTSTYSGPTTVTGGSLVLSGTLPNSTVVLGSGGSLTGSGFVAGLVASPGSVLSPGGSGIGQLMLNTVVLDLGSVTSLDIDGPATGSYDRFVLQGAGHMFAAGGQLIVNLRGISPPANNNFTPVVGQRFNVVHTDAGVAGSFASLTEPTAGLAAGTQVDALYSGTDIDLVVTPGSYTNLAALGVTETANQLSVGGAIDSYRLSPGVRMTGDRNAVLTALYSLPAANIGSSLGQIAGSVHGDVMNVAIGMNRMFTSAIGDHRSAGDQMIAFVDRLPTGTLAAINTVASPREARLDSASPFWAVGLGSWSHASGDSNASGYSADAGGVLVGVDLVAEDDRAFGLALGYAKSNVSTKDAATATVQTERLTGYGDVRYGAWRLNDEVAIAVDQYRSKRTIQVGALTRTALGESNGWTFAADGGVHYDLDFAAPFVEARYDYVSRSGFTETSAGDLSLIVQSQSLDTPRFTAGVDFDLGRLANDAPATFAMNLRLAYAHDFKRIDGLSDAALAGSPLTSFTALSSRVGLDAGIAALDTSVQVDDAVSLFGEYHVEGRARQLSQAIQLGARIEW